MTRARWIGLTAAVAAACMASQALGAGMLVPEDRALPPLAVKYLRVDTLIDHQVATTRVVQEFQNSTGRNLECTYIFPLPKAAAIRDFAMYIGGKRVKGELLDKDKARQVYEDIVRRAKDPALLEYMDSCLLRLRIFPVPAHGTQKVELEYSELVAMDDGLSEYVFPLRIGDQASRTLEDFTVAVRIKSGVPIKTVYSPTHEVGVSRPSEHEAVAGVETKEALLDRDFQLFYTVGEKDFGLNLLAFRPDPKQPGLFLMLLAPKSNAEALRRVPRDLILVLDTSGSMKGEKVVQAKKALQFCLDKLDPSDRFAVIQFSTTAQAFARGWTDARDSECRQAREWVEKFEASGGTNFAEALGLVFALPFDDARPATVLFVTDGRPTVDVTDPEALAQRVKDGNRRNLRLFTFGVGDDVNTKLLDRMSGDTGALTEYVRPGEGIDGKMTRLFSKMSHPVLTDLALEIPGVKITEMYPRQVPDLFRGSQVVVVGAYEGAGDSVIRLKGRVGKDPQEFVYEGTFPEKATDRTFIAPLYAHRKIGFLLDQIRLHGENPELKEEIIRLSLAYGIETPYTSYLVLETRDQYKQYGITLGSTPLADRDRGAEPGVPLTPAEHASAEKAAERAWRQADRIEGAFTALPKVATGNGMAAGAAGPARTGPAAAQQPGLVAGVRADAEDLRQADTGRTAIEIAQECQRLRRAENLKDARGLQNVQQRGGRNLVNYRGVWVDDRFQGTENLTKVKWGTEAYFQVLRDRPDLREALSLGQRAVLVTARGQAVAVDVDSGHEELSAAQMKELFTDVPDR